MLRIEIQPNYLSDEFDIIVELDRTRDCDSPKEAARELSVGFTVKSDNYDEAVEASMPKISEILRVFLPQKATEDFCPAFDEDLMLEMLQEVFGKENVQKVPLGDQDFEMAIDLNEPQKDKSPDFSAHDMFDNIWDDIERNYSLGDK